MIVLDEGHIYELSQLNTSEKFKLIFVKRSSKTVHHKKEWGGLQTQEVLRALIDRTKFLNSLIPCVETRDAIYHLRQALFLYEVRAHMRKIQDKNRMGEHDDSTSPRRHRNPEFPVWFKSTCIENYPIGEDGHVIEINHDT